VFARACVAPSRRSVAAPSSSRLGLRKTCSRICGTNFGLPILGRLAFAVCSLAVPVACGGGPQFVTEEVPLDPAIKPQGIVVLPVAQALKGTTALDVAARSNEIARWLMRRTDLPILGPYDFAIANPVDQVTNVLVDTDLGTRTDAAKVDLRNWIVLRVLITENRAENTRDIVDVKQKDPKKPNTWRQHGVESKVRVEVSLHDPQRGIKRAGLVWQDDDPMAFQSGGDPRPGATRLVDLALERLLIGAGGSLLGAGQRKTRGDGMLDSLPAMLEWGAPELGSWSVLHRGDADVVKEATVLGMWDRFAPDLPTRDVFNATRHPGLLVHKAVAPLQDGDVVLAVGERPIAAAYQFDRLLQQCPPQGCSVSVWRNGQKADITLQWPTLPAATRSVADE
jgi:hypothetical protein